MRKKISAAAVSALLLFNGCTLPFQEKAGDGSGFLFSYTLTQNPDSLDPQIARNSASFMILHNMMQGLVEQQPDGSITYGVSSHYSISEDELTYTFTLRNNCYWYYDENKNERIDDGETWKVTADDFVFAFQRIFNPDTRSPYAKTFSCIHNANAVLQREISGDNIGVYAQNDNTVIFRLDRRCEDFLTRLTLPAAMPCNERFFYQTQGRYGMDEDSVISNSSFYLKRWFYDPYGSDNLIYLQENSANNTVQKVYPSDVTFFIRNAQKDAEEIFRSGRSDILATSIPDESFLDSEQYTTQKWLSQTVGLVFNPESETFQNRHIREALSMTIPRSELYSTDIQGASSIIPPAACIGTESYTSRIVAGRLSAGSAADAQNEYQTGIQELGLQALKAENILVCENTIDSDCLYPIIEQWQSIFGFYAGIEVVPEDTYRSRLANRDYSIALCNLVGSDNSARSVLENFRTGQNTFHYSNPQIDEMLDEAERSASHEDSLSRIQQIEQTLLDELSFVPIFYKNQYLVYRNENSDITYEPFSGVIFFRTAKHYES